MTFWARLGLPGRPHHTHPPPELPWWTGARLVPQGFFWGSGGVWLGVWGLCLGAQWARLGIFWGRLGAQIGEETMSIATSGPDWEYCRDCERMRQVTERRSDWVTMICGHGMPVQPEGLFDEPEQPEGEERGPDADLRSYLAYNPDRYEAEDVRHVWACVPGHNDESAWFWVVQTRRGFFYLTRATCDYTGWDCYSKGESWDADSAQGAAMLAPENEAGRAIRANLLRQVRNEQPYGLEVYP